MSQPKKPSEKISERQWELALAYRSRSDDAANSLRALLFALSAGAMAYTASQIDRSAVPCLLIGHGLAIVLFGIALVLLVQSWQIQKRKADERYKWLANPANKISGYADFDNGLNARLGKNYPLDKGAFALIVVGCAVEAATKIGMTLV